MIALHVPVILLVILIGPDFQNSLSLALQQVDIPACLLGCTENPCLCADHRTAIDDYYQSSIKQVFDVSALHSVKRRHNNRSVPGWTDYVADKHDVAKMPLRNGFMLASQDLALCFLKCVKQELPLNLLSVTVVDMLIN